MFSTTRRKQIFYYLATLVVCILALLLRVALEHMSSGYSTLLPFGELPRYLFFIPVVLMAAMLVDAWAGLLATTTCTLLICYWVLPPKGQFKVGAAADVVGLILFWIVGAAVCVIAELYHRNSRRMEESETRFRVFMDNSPALAWIKDSRGRYAYFSKTLERKLGMKIEDFRDKTDFDVFPPEFAKQYRDHDLTVSTTDRPLETIEESPNPDGSLTTWLVTKFPFTANGEHFVAGVGLDITERKKVEEVWRHLSAIVESSHNAIIGKTTDGTITSWNPAAEKLYGYSATEMIGKSITVLLPPGAPNDVADILREINNREYIDNHETTRRRKDGSLVDVSLIVSPIFDDAGNIAGAATIAQDISERKRVQEALLRSEKLVATGRLAATIAHEINNPLAAAMNAIYIAKSIPAQVGEMLQLADRELRRAAHITQLTLGFYREQSNEQSSIPKLVEELLAVYSAKLRNRNVRVQRRYRCETASRRGECQEGCEGCEEHFLVSAGEMRQIISNLLANGIDALSDGGVMHIRLLRLPDRIQLTIADDGHGIRTEHLKRVFEPFFTTKEAFGTGLGLWVTQELVHKHKGTIKVRSSKGKGTVFRLTFPQARAEDGSLVTSQPSSFPRVA